MRERQAQLLAAGILFSTMLIVGVVAAKYLAAVDRVSLEQRRALQARARLAEPAPAAAPERYVPPAPIQLPFY